jgi:hypothetical protein
LNRFGQGQCVRDGGDPFEKENPNNFVGNETKVEQEEGWNQLRGHLIAHFTYLMKQTNKLKWPADGRKPGKAPGKPGKLGKGSGKGSPYLCMLRKGR